MNRNCLSYWFPRLLAAGVPVPRTEIVRTEVDLTPLCDGVTPVGWDAFLVELTSAAKRISAVGPWFLRTGQGSGKHQWRDTCHLTNLDLLPHHVGALVEWSHCVDFFGLAHDVWVVREMLPVAAWAELPGYRGMPLVTEVRAFIKGGKVVCQHCYWPEGAIAEGLECGHGMPRVGHLEDEPERCPRCDANAEILFRNASTLTRNDSLEITTRAEQVAAAFADDGAWSVDLLKTARGWTVTDMADAAMSFHYPGCEHAAEFKGART